PVAPLAVPHKLSGPGQTMVGPGSTVTVVEQEAEQPAAFDTVAATVWVPCANELVKLTCALVGGPPAGTWLVCAGVRATLKTTTSALPLESPTLTETVPVAPLVAPHSASGPEQAIVGAGVTVTEVEHGAEQPALFDTAAETVWPPCLNVVVK